MKHNIDKQLIRKLIRKRNIVRAKLNALKQSKVHDVESLEKTFKPLVNILQSKQNEVKSEPIKKEENVIKSPAKSSYHDGDDDDDDDVFVEKRHSLPKSNVNETVYEHNVSNVDDGYIFDETLPGMHDITNIPDASFMEYLDQYHELPRKYIADRIHDTENVFDTYYLRHDMETDKINFGDSELSFQGPNIIVTHPNKVKKHYPGTTGLYELLFKNIPDVRNITNSDRQNFTDILTSTNAHRRHFNANEQIAGNRGDKYTFVIKPILEELKKRETAMERSHNTKLRRVHSYAGKGVANNSLLMKYNKNPIDYIHWDDPNELVERLKLLLASQQAGNNSHLNEINSIIEELREANVIE